MSRALLTRLGKVEASRRGQAVKGRDQALTDQLVREALSGTNLGQALRSVQPGIHSSLEQQQATIRAAYRADQ
jgi:hypothetical protein